MTKWNPRVLVTLYQQEIILFQYRGQKLTKVIYWQRQTGCFLFIKPLSSDFGHTLLVVYALLILPHFWHCFILKWLLQGHCNDSWCNKLLFDVAKIQITPANVRDCKQTFLYCLFCGILTSVWKQECRDVKKGWRLAKTKTRFSVMVHSTSSSWMMACFFNTLTA